MARNTNIKLRRSATSGAIPTTANLDLGELAINTYDGKLFLKKNVSGTESIVEIGSSTESQEAVWTEYVYTATASQTTFVGSDDNSNTLSYTPLFLQVFLNGVLLDNGTDYTATSGSSVVLVNAAAAGDLLQVASFVKVIGDGDIVVNSFTGDGSTAAYTLTANPDTEDNTTVFVDGVYQEKDTYTVSGTTLTFDANVPNGASIEILIGSRNVTLSNIADLSISGDLVVDDGARSLTYDVSAGELNHAGATFHINKSNGVDVAIGNDDFYVDMSTSRVGIGTNSPTNALTVNSGTTNTVASFVSTDSGAAIQLTDSTGSSKLETTGANLRVSVDDDAAVANSAIQFRVDGSTKATINSSGNLAVNTTDGQGGIAGSTTEGIALNGQFNFIGATRSGSTPAIFNRITSDGAIVALRRDGSTFATIGVANANNLVIESTATDHTGLEFGNDILPRRNAAVVDNQTNLGTSSYRFANLYSSNIFASSVGIGTTSPASNLHIKTSVDNSLSQGLVIERSANTDRGYINYNGGAFQFRSTVGDPIVFGETDSEHLRVAPDGNVGIGTSSPTTPLHVYHATTDTVANFQSGDNAVAVNFTALDNSMQIATSGTDGIIKNNGAGSFRLFNNGSERARIDSSGNVGINVTSPSRKFEVNSGSPQIAAVIRNTNSAAVRLGFQDANTTGDNYVNVGAAGDDFVAYAGGGEKFRINSSGNVGIGTNAPNAKLQVEEYGIDTTETSTTATTQVAIHTMAAATFRSARFTVQVTNSTDSTYHLTEILMIHDGTTPSITEYGTIFTGSAEATFDADISSGNVRLLATPASTDSMEFKVICHSITV